MPRYFFNTIGRSVEMDDTGTDLPSASHAKREGAALMGALAAEGLLTRHDGRLRLEIADEAGAVLFGFDMVGWDGPHTQRAPAQANPLFYLSGEAAT